MAEQNIMLGEWAAEWFRTHAESKMPRNTEGGYRNLIFNHIIPRLGGVALTDLSEQRIKLKPIKNNQKAFGILLEKDETQQPGL